MPPLEVRVADEILADDRLLVATGDGLFVQGEENWQRALEGTFIYRLETQQADDRTWIHAGTIDAGVFTAAASDPHPHSWQPNREGLPPQADVFSFVITEDNALIAGTDRGLFWQPAPMKPWKRLEVGLENSRMLSLYLEPGQGQRARLWIGSDDGLWRVALKTTGGAPEAEAYAELVQAPPEHVRYGVSWIVPYGEGVMISAGSVYQFGPMGLAGWYWISLGGLVLLLLGGWLLPGRSHEEPVSA
jgi:hypothetical protein